MRVEAGRNDDQVRREVAQPRQDRALDRLAEPVAAVARRERRIDDRVARAAFGQRAGAGIKRHLVGRAVHHARVVPEDVLAAVAVVHVEVDDRDVFGAVGGLRVARSDRRVIEQAEAHRGCGLGMMAGRARRHERICDRARHHLVEPHNALFRGDVANLLDVTHRMHARDLIQRRHRRLLTRQGLEFLVLQRVFDRAQPVRPLRMAGRHDVVEAGRVGEKERAHAIRSRCPEYRPPDDRYLDRPCGVIPRHQPSFARLTAAGGLISSGTKKSICSAFAGSTRYLSKSATPSPARNVSSIRKFPLKLFGLLKIA